MQNIISALGSGSGIDTQKLVSDLVDIQKAPQQKRIDDSRKTLDTQISAFGTLKSSMSELQNIVRPLTNSETFNARAVNVPTTDVLTANSLNSSAQPGTYQIEVEAVAKAQSLAINTTATEAKAALGKTGNLTFKIGEWSYSGTPATTPDTFTVNSDKPSFTVAVEAGDSLEDIAKKINDAESDVTASVLQIDGKYQLLVTAESGSKNALEITSDNASLNDFEFNASNHANVSENQQGANAVIKLNGLKVERDRNEISDVIPGFSFTLNKADPGNVISFSITQDKSTAETAIRNFVEAYNTFYDAAQNLVGTKLDKETNKVSTGDLSSDSTAKGALSLIQRTISSSIPGLDSGDGFNALANVGIRTTREGKLEIIDKDFNDAVSNNFSEVAKVFSSSTSTSSSFIEASQGSYGSQATGGTYKVNITQAPEQGYIEGAVITFPFNASVGGPYEFGITVDGTSSAKITLAGNYTNADELAADLQSLINGDENIKKNTAFVDVTHSGGKLKVTSRQYGASSTVTFNGDTNAAFLAGVGFSSTTSGVAGKNVVGTIDGQEAFGSGRVLLPPVGSPAYGLNLTVKEGTPTGDYEFTFSQGFAGELNKVIDTFLASNGLINERETNLRKEITGLDEDQEDLDRSMTAYQSRLQSQYLAMERIIAGLNQTKNQLTGLIDRLPFTAKK